MKNLFYGSILLILFFITVGISLSIHGRSTRQNEMNNILSAALEQSLENAMTGSNYQITSNEEMVADFTQTLLSQVDSKSQITINVLNADIENGIFSVEIIEEFKYPNGKTGSLSYQKTAIYDTVDYQNEDCSVKHYNICFYYKKSLDSDFQEYKTYSLGEGDPLIIPKNPESENATFLGWIDIEGNPAHLDEQVVDKDISYYANMSYN